MIRPRDCSSRFGLWTKLPLPAKQRTLLAEAQLFGQRIAQVRRRKKVVDQSDAIVKTLTELTLGALVVHVDHGVGRYMGPQTIEVDGQATEFLMLTYADEAKLYVPVTSLHLISLQRDGQRPGSVAQVRLQTSGQLQNVRR